MLTAVQQIQSTWRSVSDQVLRRRLARAADALRKGGMLFKYRKHGAIKERHQKFVWVSNDLQRLHWAPSAEQRGDVSVVRTAPMSGITAITSGCKTRLMKRMEKRAATAQEHARTISFGSRQVNPAVGSLGGAPFGRTLSLMKKPLALDETCAFSIFCHERVLDFVADDKATRDRWLRDLQTALMYAHHLDPTAAKLSVQKLAASSSSDSEDEAHHH